MAYYRDLRAFLDVLEEQDRLFRFTDPIDKDTELLPLIRVQQRGLPADQRKVFLFSDVRSHGGQRFDIGVAAGVYGASDDIILQGLGCSSHREAFDRLAQALDDPIEPSLVDGGPVHEVVHTGGEITERGLDLIPAPVEEPGFSQIIRTGLPIITKDPETGQRNVGGYNAFFRDRDRMVTGAGMTRHITRHWLKARQRGEDLPVAIVIGATPNIMLAACTTLPYGSDELAYAGGIAGEPVELVRCKTVPLEVPAHAEIVIEGLLSTKTLEPRLAFGEYPGYMHSERTNVPVMRVTAITHRRDAVFTPVLVGFPPVESTTLSNIGGQAAMFRHLKRTCGLPVADVGIGPMGGSLVQVIQLERGARANTWQVLETGCAYFSSAKYWIVVDHDIDPRDQDAIWWALSFRVKPERDISIQRGRYPGLDPSNYPAGGARGMAIQSAPGTPRDYFRVLIDATMKGPYPAVALPRREYMERALEIWNRYPQLPKPKLREPWFGYDLGYWTEDDQRLADLIAQGDYRAVGQITAEMQLPADEALPE